MRSAKIAADMIAREKKIYGDNARPTPLEYISSIMWNEALPFEIRYDAAKAVLPYTAARFTSVKIEDDTPKLTIVFKDMVSSQTITSSVPVITSPAPIRDAIIAETIDDQDE